MKTKVVPIATRQLSFTPLALLILFQRKEQHFRIENPIPDDVEIIKTEYQQDLDRIVITIQSNQFTNDKKEYVIVCEDITTKEE